MTTTMTRADRRRHTRRIAKLPARLSRVPREQWPADDVDPRRVAVYLSREFLVQVFVEANGVTRISVNRAAVQGNGQWHDGISWDDMQDIKRQIGFADRWAYECYPADSQTVNVANMRHLWIIPVDPEIGWRDGVAA